MVSFQRSFDAPYTMECSLVDVNEVCNREKSFPASWITVSGSDIAPEFCSYVLPLIQGEPKRLMSHGLPVYAYRK